MTFCFFLANAWKHSGVLKFLVFFFIFYYIDCEWRDGGSLHSPIPPKEININQIESFIQ